MPCPTGFRTISCNKAVPEFEQDEMRGSNMILCKRGLVTLVIITYIEAVNLIFDSRSVWCLIHSFLTYLLKLPTRDSA